MTPQELKDSIIHLAMKGELVEQIAEEGDSEFLIETINLERIQKIKNKLAKENKKVEPITEDIIPFDIPETWRWIRFGDLVSYNMGKTPPRAESQWWGGDVPWVSIADMPESGHVVQTKEYVSTIALSKKFSNRISKDGTLLMSFKLTVGRVSILDIDAVHNEAIISIYPYADVDNTIKNYLFLLLPYISQLGESKNAIKGKTLNDTSISNLLIPLPPIAEQKRIVAKIEELLPYVERYEQAWNKLEEFNKKFPVDMQKSVLQMAIQGKLVEQRPEEGTGEELFNQIQAEKQELIKSGKIKKEKLLPEITEEEIPFSIPENWTWARLKDICTKIVDGDHNPPAGEKNKTEYWMLSAQNVNQNQLVNLDHVRYLSKETFERANERTNLNRGDILFTIVATLGRSCVYEGNYNICFQRSVSVITTLVYNYYLKCVLDSGYIQEYMSANATGTAQKGFYLNQVNQLLIPVPPLAEQKRIVQKLEEILPLCEKLK